MDKKEKNEKVAKVEKVEKIEKNEKTEKNVKVEKNDKKNYSIIIAIALIEILVVAMICIGCSKKNNELPSGNNNDNIVNENVVPDNNNTEEPGFEDSMFPEYDENTERDDEGNKERGIGIRERVEEKVRILVKRG